MFRKSKARHANTIEDLDEMESFDRELMRATKEHITSIMWALSAISLMLCLTAFGISRIELFANVWGTMAAVMGGSAVFFALASLPTLRQIRNIDNRDLEGAEEFFAAIKDRSVFGQ